MTTPYQGDGPLILAHRGGGGETVENSWAALEHMRAHGLTAMETDARVTSDGVVVLHHDSSLERMCARPESIRSLTWRELSAIKDASGSPLVRLDEALASFPEMRFNADAKDITVVGPLARIAADHHDRVVISSFSSFRLALANRYAPGTYRSMGMSGVGLLRLLSAISRGMAVVMSPVSRGVIAVQVPETFNGIPVTTPSFIAAAHRLNIEVHVWTVDETETAQKLVGSGVDGIVTDTPVAMAEFLAATGPVRR